MLHSVETAMADGEAQVVRTTTDKLVDTEASQSERDGRCKLDVFIRLVPF